MGRRRREPKSSCATSRDPSDTLPRSVRSGGFHSKERRRDIDPAANLFDFGYVDSLSGVMFLARIEEQWGVHIEDFDLVESLNTIEAVAARLRTSR